MKKILFLCVLVSLSICAFPQSSRFGIKAGGNFAKITNLNDIKMRPGAHVGFFVECPIQTVDILAIQVECLYSMQGYRSTGNGRKFTDKEDYITLPIIAKIYFFQGLSFNVGPQFGYLISSKEVLKYNGNKTTNNTYNADNLKKFDFSVALGLSCDITSNIDAYLRYNIGTTEIIENYDYKNGVLQIGLGCKF